MLYWLSLKNIQNSLLIIWLVDALSDKSNKMQAERIERQIETIMVNSEYQDQLLSAESQDSDSKVTEIGRQGEIKMLKSVYNNTIITFIYALIKFSLNAKAIPHEKRNLELRKLLHKLNSQLIENRKKRVKGQSELETRFN